MTTKTFFTRLPTLVTISLLLGSTGAMTQNTTTTSNTEAVAILTRYEVKEGQQKTFLSALGKYIKQANAQTGNIMAEGYYEQDNPSILWTIERWSSKAAFDKNRKLLAGNKLVQPAKTIYVKDLEPLTKEQWQRKPGKDDKPVTIMLFVDSKPGTEATFKTVYHTAMPQFRSEPGVINYQLSQLEEDSTQFVTYEKFRNDEAFQYHLKFPPIQPVLDYLNSSIKKQPFQSGLHRLIEFAPVKQQ
jgi:quinol monooxygenase YgiN